MDTFLLGRFTGAIHHSNPTRTTNQRRLKESNDKYDIVARQLVITWINRGKIKMTRRKEFKWFMDYGENEVGKRL
jgi:hypothetical protein